MELPEEVQAALDEHEETSQTRLAALGLELAKRRTEAINYRRESGIEGIWAAAEEAYAGVDAANRAPFSGPRMVKPQTMSGGLRVDSARGVQVDSTAVVRLTSRYVDAGAAKAAEILLPIGEKAFSFTNSPLPDMVRGLNDKTQAIHDGLPLEREVPPAQPGMPPQVVPITVADIAQEASDKANEAAKKAERRVYDWMVESAFPTEVRKVIFDMARIGTGVLKGPFPRKRVSRAVSKEKKALIVDTRVVPAYTWVDPWNIYPDPACGERIGDGDYCFEYDQFSARQLRKLRGSPGYITSAIDKVLAEGPREQNEQPQNKDQKSNKHRYGVWYYYGTLAKEDLIAAGDIGRDEPSKDEVYAICTMVNDTVIRATINPLDSGEFPYHAAPWQRRPGTWTGVGVGEQLEMPQRAVTAATRALFNNAGKSAGSIIVMDDSGIVPADNSWVLTPDKIFKKTTDSTADDIRKAFAFFQVPNMTPQLMVVIEYCLRVAEESTNIPLITQGQSGKTTPETFGATQLQNNNASQLLRSIGYAFDDYITEPVVRQSYEMLLLDDTVPDDEKGDWAIDARGSSALVERAIQNDTIQQMGQFVINPAFGVDPKRWFAEFSRTKHLNPKTFQYTKEEQAKIDAAPKPQAPAIEVAKIRSADAKEALAAGESLATHQSQIDQAIQKMVDDTKLQIAQMKKESDDIRVQRDTDRDTVYTQAESARTQAEAAARMRELEVKRELALLDYANKRDMKLEDVKTKLADTQMKLDTERELASIGHAVDVHKHRNPPPVQVPGKAPDGKAFSQV